MDDYFEFFSTDYRYKKLQYSGHKFKVMVNNRLKLVIYKMSSFEPKVNFIMSANTFATQYHFKLEYLKAYICH